MSSYSSICFLLVVVTVFANSIKSTLSEIVFEISDNKWDQIQKGEWLLGFFDKDTEESKQLQVDWSSFSHKCALQSINVGQVHSLENQGLTVRFLVTTFPKVFYIRNGVAHEVPKPVREVLNNLIDKKEWSTLKPVNFLNNPFSVQMSLLSHLFIHAVNLYNYEDVIVQKFIPISSATDVAFALTFIVVGTALGLIATMIIGLVSLMFMDKAAQEDDSTSAQEDESEEDTKENESSESSQVRKRK